MKTTRKEPIKPFFVSHYSAGDFVPDDKDDMIPGVIYISERFSTSKHLCLCGCGGLVVLPFNEEGWKYENTNGQISITPSVLNNWCGSHYIITNGVANFV
jgi:hypothetical protein